MISSISSLTRFGSGLGLHALGRVHHQHRAFACGERTRDLIVKVHVARGVDEVQGVSFPVPGLVVETYGAGLDGDAALAFQVHVVEDLILHDALLHRAALFDEAVGEGGLAVVDMGNDGKIADIFLVDHRSLSFVSYSPSLSRASPMRLCSRSK